MRALRFFKTCCLLAAAIGLAADGRCADPAPLDAIRLGFTSGMFSGVNENDAKASITALAQAISRERGLPADPEAHLLPSSHAAATAIKAHMVNAVAMTTDEYWILRREVEFGGFLFGVTAAGPFETYLIVVPIKSPVHDLAQLKAAELLVLKGPRMSLALAWLDVVLLKQELPPAAAFFRHRVESSKASKVILPVFFQQSDACLINRRTLDAMVELNPQIARQVRVVAQSPEYVPSLFALSNTLSPPFLARALRQFEALHTTPAGQQVLTIFQTDRVATGARSTLDASTALLDEHERICRATHAASRAGKPVARAQP